MVAVVLDKKNSSFAELTTSPCSLLEDYEHYDKNRRKSQNIRNDLPVAKTFQDIEYQELLKRHQALEEM